MPAIGRKETLIGLLLLWLVLTGSYAGWQRPELVIINVALWAVLVLLNVTRFYAPAGVEWAILAMAGATLLSAAATGAWSAGLKNAGVWIGYLMILSLSRSWPDRAIQGGALLALVPILVFSVLPWENSNVIAFSLLGLVLLSARQVLIYPAILLIGALHSIGGVLATLVANLGRFPQGRVVLGVSFLPLVLLGYAVSPLSFSWRLRFWADAWQDFTSSPLWGIGPGNYESAVWGHAHNTVFSTAATTGLIGLAALGLLVWVVVRRWSQLPSWALVTLAAFAAWSLVDEPLGFWGPGAMMMMALSRVCTQTETQ